MFEFIELRKKFLYDSVVFVIITNKYNTYIEQLYIPFGLKFSNFVLDPDVDLYARRRHGNSDKYYIKSIGLGNTHNK